MFARNGFTVSSHYLSGLAYRYVASRRARLLLPIYNFIDGVVFSLRSWNGCGRSCSPPARNRER